MQFVSRGISNSIASQFKCKIMKTFNTLSFLYLHRWLVKSSTRNAKL